MDYYTTHEAAVLLGIRPKTVARFINRKLITAEKRGRDYLIRPEEIDRFQTARKRAGRPKKLE